MQVTDDMKLYVGLCCRLSAISLFLLWHHLLRGASDMHVVCRSFLIIRIAYKQVTEGVVKDVREEE